MLTLPQLAFQTPRPSRNLHRYRRLLRRHLRRLGRRQVRQLHHEEILQRASRARSPPPELDCTYGLLGSRLCALRLCRRASE